MLRFPRSAVVIVAFTLMLCGLAHGDPIDLSSWTALTLDLPEGQPAGEWVLEDPPYTVTQIINADPSFFLNNLNQSSYTMDGTWQVITTADDDLIGFAFGYQDPAHCYIMDWKQAWQTLSPYGTAEEGFTIRRISAPDPSVLTLPDFWASEGTEYTTILAAYYGDGLGWDDQTAYDFHLRFDPGSFTVRVKMGETTLWEVTIEDATYPSGEFGFYNFSQEQVQYSGFEENFPPQCEAGGPYEGCVGVPLTFDGTGSYDPDGSIVSYEWDFGDGSTGEGPTPTHTYVSEGMFTVVLCVTDDDSLVTCCGTEAVITGASNVRTVSWGSIKSVYR